MKKFLLVLALFFSFFAAGTVFGQEDPDEIAAKYGVTFPITELGDCASLAECRTYCEDPLNFDVCVVYAKEKGFYQGEDEAEIQVSLARARASLGCTSIEECHLFCEDEENYDRCHSFAISSGLAGGYIHDVDSGEILARAREVLGCNSYDSCLNFCDNPTNRDKCSQFAESSGLGGGYEYRGPGGCTTEETCRDFCSIPENVGICSNFSEGHGGRFVGPGGCTDEASCQEYCERSPSSCSVSGESPASLAEYCSKTPNCSWTGTTCQCSSEGSFEGDPEAECSKYGCSWTGSYCQCAGSDSQYNQSHEAECSKYPGCSWTGSSCQCSNSDINYSNYSSSDPATECTKYSGCKWENNSCQCGSGSTYTGGGESSHTPYPTSGSYSAPSSGGTYDPATECARTSGCSWNGSSCQCSSSGGSSGSTTITEQQPSSGSMDPATACAQTSGCSWDGSTCQCSSVQGVDTVYVKTWWQKLLDLLE